MKFNVLSINFEVDLKFNDRLIEKKIKFSDTLDIDLKFNFFIHYI